jgi:VWFA-related protein
VSYSQPHKMWHRHSCLCWALTIIPPLFAQEPLVRVPVRLVIAPTSVTDQHGKFINGLTLSDFTLFDNDVPQQIHEDADFLPISLAVAIETNLTVEGILPRIRELGPLLGTLVVGDGGECSIMTFDKHINVVQDFTSDLGRLTQALQHVEFNYVSSHLIDATLQAIHLLKQRPPERRRILLLISETRDQGSESNLRDAVADAELNNILIYSLNVSRLHAARQIILPAYGGPSGTALSLDLKALIKEIYGGIKTLVIENPLSVLTRYTGGRQYPFLKQHSLEEAVTKIGEEIHGQYLLSYSPSNLQEAGFHKIRVDLNKTGLTVRNRPGYWSDVAQAFLPVLGF